jgi:lysophospholipase L1-like esterase
MHMSIEQVQWMMKILQPERTLGSMPGASALTEALRASLLGVDPEIYSAELARMRRDVKSAAGELLAEPAIAKMVDRLPLPKGARVLAFGDSHTSDPQSWAFILGEMLAVRRPRDEVSVTVSAVPGETTTHGLVRVGEALASDAAWVIFLLGVNDARTQGPSPTKTLVDHSETARNLAEIRHRVSSETKARCLWIAPAAVNEDRIAAHWGFSRFGVRFKNEAIASVVKAVRDLGDPTIDLFATLGAPPPPELLTDDGLHFTLAGQKRVAREVVQGWSER